MHQLDAPSRRKAIKKTSSGLTGKFTIKEPNSIWELFFLNFDIFFVF